ncbi:MAG: histidinol-phosphate transaminase [Dokdonella sp.]
MNPLDLVRPELLALNGYSSARLEAGSAPVMLNANESPWPPAGNQTGLNRYPEPQPEKLRQRLAELYGVATGQLLIGRGSDEAIDLLVRAFCRSGEDAIAICPPTFGMYAVCARIQGADVVEIPQAADGLPELDALLQLPQRCPNVKLVFLCSPGNPTGSLLPLAMIEQIATALRGRALLVVDEAYMEYAEVESPARSALSLLAAYPHVAVLRTLSKAWALAGARIGCLLADAQVIALLRKIMPPYPLPTPCVEAALQALDAPGRALMQQRGALIVAERERMAAALGAMAQVSEVLPSSANFLCVRFVDAVAAQACLAASGIVVRDVSRYPGLQDCLRLSIGSDSENDRVLAALRTSERAA